MTWTYAPGGSSRDLVRMLCTDTDSLHPILQDEEIDALFALEEDERLAAADALDMIASNETLIQKAMRLGDITTNGPAVAASLRAHAATLRQQANETAGFEIAEQVNDQFSWRQRILNEWERHG